MKESIVAAIKKQLIKLAIAGAVVAVGLGFRLYDVANDDAGDWDAEVVEESLEEGGDLAANEAEPEGGEKGGVSSLFSFAAGDDNDEMVSSNRAVPCYVNGQKLYMLKSDCVTRGGLPELH